MSGDASAAKGIVYHVAGPADDEDFAQAEYLGEMLMSSLRGVDCAIHCVLPEDWSGFIAEKSAFLGCKQRAPLIWMSSGVVVGGLPEFTAEVDLKYGINARHVDYSTWSKCADENLANARAKARGDEIPRIGSSCADESARGAAIAEELRRRNALHLAGTSDPPKMPQLPDGPVATVLVLTKLPAPPHELLGREEASDGVKHAFTRSIGNFHGEPSRPSRAARAPSRRAPAGTTRACR